jgi:hypothetical protein
MAHLRHKAVERAALAVEVGAIIDDRDLRRRRGIMLDPLAFTVPTILRILLFMQRVSSKMSSRRGNSD